MRVVNTLSVLFRKIILKILHIEQENPPDGGQI